MLKSEFRHRAEQAQRVIIPDEEDADEHRKKGERRKPSTASACSAKFRSQVEFNALDESAEDIADALVRAMSREKLKNVCLDALRRNGFAVTLRDKAKRDRSKESARRSQKRALARAEKAAKRVEPNGALPAMET